MVGVSSSCICFLFQLDFTSSNIYFNADRVGAWGSWQPTTTPGGEPATAAAAAAPLLQISPARKLTAQHVLAVLDIVHKEQYPMNRET